jgi:hypothetical protein
LYRAESPICGEEGSGAAVTFTCTFDPDGLVTVVPIPFWIFTGGVSADPPFTVRLNDEPLQLTSPEFVPHFSTPLTNLKLSCPATAATDPVLSVNATHGEAVPHAVGAVPIVSGPGVPSDPVVVTFPGRIGFVAIETVGLVVLLITVI